MLPHNPLTAKVEGLYIQYNSYVYYVSGAFLFNQQKENYRMMGAFTRKSLVKTESKRKRKKISALMG